MGGSCPGLGTTSSNIPAAHCANHSASRYTGVERGHAPLCLAPRDAGVGEKPDGNGARSKSVGSSFHRQTHEVMDGGFGSLMTSSQTGSSNLSEIVLLMQRTRL